MTRPLCSQWRRRAIAAQRVGRRGFSGTGSPTRDLSPLLRTAEVQRLLEAMHQQPDASQQFLLLLKPHLRRSIAIQATAAERKASPATLGAAVASADTNADGLVSRREFSRWLSRTAADGAFSGSTTTALQAPTGRQLALFGLNAAIPMVGFGFMDNAVMICAGDAIDASIGTRFGISMMASAALGNMCSDVVGIGMGDVVESAAKRCGLPSPALSPEQLSQRGVKIVGVIGSVVGICVGCILGMAPLAFMEDDFTRLVREMYTNMDTNGDGELSEHELARVFRELGTDDPEQAAAAVIASFGGERISFEQFLKHSKLCGLASTTR